MSLLAPGRSEERGTSTHNAEFVLPPPHLFSPSCNLSPFIIQNLSPTLPLAHPTPSGPFKQLEACLRLAFAFSEGGHNNTKILSDGPFPELIRALHGTDVAQHPHPQVLLWYYDLSVRYLPQAMDLAPQVAQTMVGPHGLFHGELQVRCKAAQCLLRLVEQMGPGAIVLLSLTGLFAGTFPLLSRVFIILYQ